MMADDWHTLARNAFVYALATTVLLLSSSALILSYTSRGQQELAARVDHNAEVAVVEARQTRQLFCAILIEADNPDIRVAVRTFCEDVPRG